MELTNEVVERLGTWFSLYLLNKDEDSETAWNYWHKWEAGADVAQLLTGVKYVDLLGMANSYHRKCMKGARERVKARIVARIEAR